MTQLSLEEMARAAIKSIQELSKEDIESDLGKLRSLIETVMAAKSNDMANDAWNVVKAKYSSKDSLVIDSLDLELRFVYLDKSNGLSAEQALAIQSTRCLNMMVYGAAVLKCHLIGATLSPDIQQPEQK